MYSYIRWVTISVTVYHAHLLRTCTSMLLCGVQQGIGVCGSLSHGGVSQLGITEHWSHSAEKNNCAESLESLNTRPNPEN